ncbi:hypothetical protein BLNAU_4360 [Blattamonas nauphoetae]|uniref:Uncharacterized protein n=1 Tax=Blattamonas nauphoetae TaxID=2049346 RepID=A0ABQ9XV65_9EUKA|nr:hypothetical protein BLNAU_23233 [Blattamonas nauphoetae]KAK2942945.1 hypothetical protein BLNAU_22156 [Blattamonas nauphoetae]KAK2944077.1 hypothetical protein BLNAU_20994 [Blattamonas nauphoetae]KAK2944146.1 hypothetical protein BLNAU_20931 [Blattamonas nauphoetae]KAK2944752.1 hypothetical protein BLNAU_20338 [Blattamonas nauphoetae]
MHVGSCFWIPFGTLHLWDTDQHAIEVIPPAVYARKVQIPSETTFLDKILLIRQNLMLHQCRQSSSSGVAVADDTATIEGHEFLPATL